MPSGVFRTVDRLGRVVLPVEFRRALGIGDHDLVEMSLDDDRVVVTKVERACTFCGGEVDLREHHGKLVCSPCVTQLALAGTRESAPPAVADN